MKKSAKKNDDWKGDYKVWFILTDGTVYPGFFSYANNKHQQLPKLKKMIQDWRSGTIERAIFYDRRIPDTNGEASEVARYQDGKFTGA